MEQLETLKDLILPVLDSLDIQLYDLKWVNDKKARILQIAVMRADGSMDIDTCALVSEKISEVLDAHDDLIRSEYFLEVCSPGAERELRSPQEIEASVGKHIHVRLKSPVKNMMEITGDLQAVDGSTLTVSYRDKAVSRTVQFDLEQIDLIRLAVKI